MDDIISTEDLIEILAPFLILSFIIIMRLFLRQRKELMRHYFNVSINFYAVDYDSPKAANFVVNSEPEFTNQTAPPPFRATPTPPPFNEVKPPAFKKIS